MSDFAPSSLSKKSIVCTSFSLSLKTLVLIDLFGKFGIFFSTFLCIIIGVLNLSRYSSGILSLNESSSWLRHDSIHFLRALQNEANEKTRELISGMFVSFTS